MDEQQAIKRAIDEAYDFILVAHFKEDVFASGMALMAALEVMALAHENRLCKCGHKYSSHHGLCGGDCLETGECPCTEFTEAV